MRRVKQLDEDGCGLACVAMLTARTYPAVRKDFPDKINGTHLRDLRAIMRHYGVKCGERLIPLRTRKPSDLPFDALIKINPRVGGKEWHWVIWDQRRRRILDPKVPPYKRRKCISYVRLRRAPQAGA